MSSRSGRGATLSEKRRKLLAQRLKGRGGDRAASTIPRRTETGPVRLSFAQERLWFLDRWQPGTAVYNLPDVIRLRGRLRPELLAASLRMVLQRHEVLRTVFPQRDGVPYQVVQLCPAQPVTAVDLTGLTPADRRRAGEELISQEATRAFDLQTGPVVRFRLLRLAAKDHRLILNMHHIVADLWSFGILVQELGILYRSHCEGKRPPLEPLALQYADFALWQRQRLSGERLAGELGFWRRQLAGFPQVLELPSDRPRPVHLSSRGRSLSFRFRRFEASALKELAQHSEATLVMVLLAAFQALLGRLSGQRRFLLGSPVAGRTRSELEPLVGLFVNTLVLPTDLGGDPRFEDLVARARETLVDALSHQELPFERLVEELQPEREPSRPPLVQVLFAMQNAPVPALRLPELTLARADAETGTTKFDLTLFLGEEDGALGGALEYAEDLFDGTRMLRLVGQLETLLAAGVENPARRLGELPLLSPAEAQQLREWSRGPTEAPSEAPELPRLHQIFEHSAAAHGDTAAVLHGTVELTYRQVEAQANRLARVLRRRGVVPGALVGLCLERSPELVVAILAVLKSGAAYVPLDAAYPAERLGAMVDDAGLRKVITGGASGAALEPLASRRELDLLRLEELRGELEAASPKPPAAGSVPREGVGYVIFTSGSTGRPKGVALGQRVLASLMEWQESALPGPARTLQLAPVSFDVHCQEIFSTFRGGGTLVLVDEETRRDARALLHHLREHRVERLFLPFVALQQLSAAAEADGFICPALLDVITAGEQLQVDESLRDFFRRHPCCRLHNHYGPSESHVVTALSLSPEPAGWPTLPSIGRPVAAAAVRLGGRRLDPVPIGVDGELLLGRLAPAHGYTGRPALTAERFVPDPFTSRPGGRLYRTGDRARYLADGRLQFLGRWDHQVKVRGYRIEPGEIEAALRRHPAVEEAVVRLQHRGASHLLVAYLQGSAEPRDLRALLRRSLPEYMVPDSFVRLDALPLTPSGKVDRQALAAPEGPAGLARRCVAAGAESPAGAMVGPRDALESELVEIWAQVLGVDPSELGVEESFFSLGGHSLQTTRVAARIQGRWGVELPLRRLFDDPTIAGLAREVTRVLAGEARDGAPVIPRASRHRPLSLSFAQERLWFLHRLAPKAATYNIPVALRLEGELRVAPLAAALEQVRRRHEVLRTVYRSDAQGPRQEVLEEVPQALTVVDLQLLPAAAAETELQRLADREAARPFDLEKGPVMRCLLVRLGLAPQCHGLLLTVHHIAADGASLGLLVQETMELYRAMEAGGGPTAARLATLPIQYADYAVWQRERLRGELLESQMRYWRKRFDPLPKVLELPTDRPRPPVYSHRGASLPVALPRALVADLEGLAKDHRTTLFAVLLSAWQILLHRFTGQAQLLLGTPVSGRRQPELEALVGCFLNTLVISADFRSDPAFGEFLERTRTELLEALAHQDLPFERLVEGLQPRRDPSRPPLVQALVGLHHVPLSPGRVATVELTPMEQAESSAKADLSLILERTAETVDGVLEFATDLFDRTTIQRLHGQLLRLLERIGGFREQGSSLPVGRWPVVSAAACHQLLVEWGTGPFPQRALQGGQPEPFHRRVAVWAQRQPQARAVVAKDGSWSYGELDSWSLSLAHRLVRRGLELEEPVGLFLGRSPEMVGSLLAVLRAGGAFVPLDPAYPPDRLAFMIEDAGVSTVLTLRSLAPELPAAVDSLVLVDAPGEGLGTSREEWERALPAVAPSALAYIIYTSGSTGRPKGVAVHHGGLSHLWAAQEQVFGVGPGDRVLQFAALSFDASIFEIAMALAAGAALFLTPPEAAVSGPPLRKFLAMQGISVATLTPSALATLPAEDLPAEDLPAGDLASLDTLVVAGEACPPELAERWTESAAGRRFFNAYGPTEVTVWASTELYCRQRALGIGRPIPGAHVAVLDRRGELSPASVPGQLHIGGPGVARGYRGRPSLTADRFRPDPAALGGRLYSTGDLARWRPDGRLDFLGRLDHQVKVRGFRIELGEVEAAVAGLAGIREAVAAVLSPATGEPRLAVYFVPDSSSPPEVEALRQAVRRRLPEHMVPSAWVLLERLPLAVTGKVDRRALPSPERQDLGLAAVVPPRDRLELELLDLFRQILGPVVAGVFDDFFEAGGHSLAAIRLVAGVEAKLGFPLPLTALFEAGTVAALAQRLRSAESTPGSREILVPICSPGSSSSPVSAPVPPLVLVHPVGGNVFSYAALAQSLRRERPVMAIQSPPPESWPVPPSVEAMAARYLQELGSWSGRPAAGMPVLAGWSLGAVVAFEMARQAAQAGAEVSAVLLIDPPTPPFGEVGEQAGGDEDEARIAAAFLLDLTGFGGAGSDDAVATEGIIRELAALGPRERAQEILHRAVAARALPATESVDRVEALLSLFRLNARALAAYRPLPAAERAMASSAPPVHLYRAKGSSEDPDEGAWRRLCAPSHLMIHPLTGDHYSLLRAPGVAELGRAMEETLAALPAIPARLAGSS